MSDPAKIVSCRSHGDRAATFVCQHLAQGISRGFNTGYDPDCPADPFPDAWCDDCEERLDESGQWTKEAEEFANITLLCSGCYVTARLRNQAEPERRRFVFQALADAEEMHRNSPRTFSIPRSDERKELTVGKVVKLIFQLGPPEDGAPEAERMWVEVTEVKDGGYAGVLSNTPFFITDLDAGSNIEFRPEHVCAIYCLKDQPGWVDESQLASCAVEIMQEGQWPASAFRSKASKSHSGWKFLVDATEPNPRLEEVALSDLIQRFPIVDSILGEPEGTSWQWIEAMLEYQRLKSESGSD